MRAIGMAMTVVVVVAVASACGNGHAQTVADEQARCRAGERGGGSAACTNAARAYLHDGGYADAVELDRDKARELLEIGCERERTKKRSGSSCKALLEHDLVAGADAVDIGKWVCERRAADCGLLAKAANAVGDTALAAEATKKKNDYDDKRAAARAAREAKASDDDDDDEMPAAKGGARPATKKKGSGSGFGQGNTRDLACAAAKLQATQNAGCDDITSAIGGEACDCNKVGIQFICNAQVTCR